MDIRSQTSKRIFAIRFVTCLTRLTNICTLSSQGGFVNCTYISLNICKYRLRKAQKTAIIPYIENHITQTGGEIKMTMLQKQAVQLIQNMSDDNLSFLIEIIQRLISSRAYTKPAASPANPSEKMQAFKELAASRKEIQKYIPEDFDPEAELEAFRKERYGRHISANYIVTRNTADFETSTISAIEPTELLKKLN